MSIVSSNGVDEILLPEINVRVSGRDVLVQIMCEKHQGLLVKILQEIEKIHLTITNSNFMSFGPSVMDLTVLAQMEAEANMGLTGFVANLRSVIAQFP